MSAVTVRSDLRALEATGSLRRVRGGALPGPSSIGPRSTEAEVEAEADAHADPAPGRLRTADSIGRCAAAQVATGDVVAVDAGPLGIATASALRGRHDIRRLVAVTNSLPVAGVLSSAPWLTVVVTGGTVGGPHESMFSPYVGPSVQELRPDVVFVETCGVSVDGAHTDHAQPGAGRREWLAQAQRVVLLAPSHVLGRSGPVRLCPLDAVDLIVTDASEEAEGVTALREHGVEVVTV